MFYDVEIWLYHCTKGKKQQIAYSLEIFIYINGTCCIGIGKTWRNDPLNIDK